MKSCFSINSLGRLSLITMGYAILATWALQLKAPPEDISVMWLPDGYLLACLVLLPGKYWLPLCLMVSGTAFILEYLAVARPFGLILSFQLANMLESVGGALTFLYVGKGKSWFVGYRHLSSFLLFAVFFLPACSAVIGAGSLVLYSETEHFWPLYQTWWLSAGLGNLFVAPLVLYLALYLQQLRNNTRVMGSENIFRQDGVKLHGYGGLWLMAILSFVVVLVVSLPALDHYARLILTFLTLPLLIWSSIRFGMLGASVIASIVAVGSVHMMAMGNSVFTDYHTSLSAAVVELQGYLGVSIVAAYFTALSSSKARQNIQALTQVRDEFKGVLEYMPVSLWVEDFSQVRQFMDRSLEQSDTDLRTWLNDNPEALPALAGKVSVLSVNQATLDLYGARDSAELLGSLAKCFNDESLQVFREELIGLYECDDPFKAESVQLKVDGSTIYTRVNVMVMPGCYDNWERVLVAVEDLSARKKAENAINHFFDQPMNLHLIARFDGTILRVNRGWETILGYNRTLLEGMCLLDFIHPDDVEPTVSKMEGLSQGETVHYFENRYCHKKEGFRWLAWSAVASMEDELIYAVASDITERKEAETSLVDSRQIFRSTGEGIILTELDGTIRDVNPAFTVITGYEKAEVQGRHIRILQSGRQSKGFYRMMWKSIARTGSWQGEIWNRRKDGSVYPEYLTINGIRNKDGDVVRYVGVFSDMTHVKHSEERLFHISTHDSLTDLPNRTLLMELIDKALKRAVRHRSKVAILLIDIDGFKHINDSLGPESGDQLLLLFAERLQSTVRSDDTVARISGDEFVVVYEGIRQLSELTRTIESLMDQLSPSFSLADKDLPLTVSIGVSVFPDDGDKGDYLLRNADAAMFRAKEHGRNNFQFYTEELTASAFEHMFIESSLRHALNEKEFRLVYQPQYRFSDGTLSGFEALLRWHSQSRGVISPGRFIPIAEQSGFMREIGNWVLLEACIQGRCWLDKGLNFGRIAVNISGPQIKHGDLVEQVCLALNQSGLPACHLELEVTENFVMTEIDATIRQLQQLRDMGIEIAIDDFGTGYSSLSYLKKLPVNKLKIDQSFVREIHQSQGDLAIAEAIIAMAKALDLKTIAEGVETQAQADLLIDKGCQQVQGFLYHKPASPEVAEGLMTSERD